MEKIKILGIAPYQEMEPLMRDIAKSYDNLELYTFTGFYKNAIQFAKAFPDKEFDVIVSRGGTADLVRSLNDTPVVKIKVSTLDLLRVITQALQCSSRAAMNTKVMGVDVNTLKYQVPGGMLSNLVSQLKQQGREDAYDEVLKEVPRVRADFGYPPLVTPSSQIVGTQAVLNVLMGERYKMVSKESKGLVRGEYGKCPAEISDEIVKKIIGDEKRITCRPADLLKPELEQMKKECAEWIEQPEDVLSYALFGQVAVKFFEYRRAQKYKIDADLVDMENKTYPV